jgi:hypothetical protein
VRHSATVHPLRLRRSRRMLRPPASKTRRQFLTQVGLSPDFSLRSLLRLRHSWASTLVSQSSTRSIEPMFGNSEIMIAPFGTLSTHYATLIARAPRAKRQTKSRVCRFVEKC